MENKFWNPFTYLAGGKALLIGLLGIITAAFLGYVGAVHFDGVIDIHSGVTASYWVFVAEGLVNVLSISFVMYVAALVVSPSKVRVVDIVGTQAFARLPLLLPVAAGSVFPLNRMDDYALYRFAHIGEKVVLSNIEIAGFILFSLTTLVAMVWLIIWMYQGYKVSANLRGAKSILSFVVAVLLAEVIAVVFIRKILFNL
jgi:hypothetical protein